jgi:cell division protein FtsQ
MTTTAVRPQAQRFAERARRDRRRRWVRRVLVLLVAGSLGLGVWAVGWSTVLGVRQVSVTGEHRASAQQITQAAKVPMNHPLLRVDLQGIAHRVAQVPTIAHVSVTRRWPHGIRISVVERVPVAVVRRGGDRRLIDATGVDFAPAPDQTTYPFLDLDVASASREDVRAGLAVLHSLPTSVARQLSSLVVIEATDVRLHLDDDSIVYWGSAANAQAKGVVLAALRLANPGAKTFDVSAPNAPAVIP